MNTKERISPTANEIALRKYLYELIRAKGV